MPQHRILLSLITKDNDFQRAQAEAAKAAAQERGLLLEIQYAENDAVLQVQQILRALQEKSRSYNAVIAAPVGTSMEQAARLASSTGAVWGILNHDTTYISTLRRQGKATQFEVTSNHLEIGRIAGRQLAALLPGGGTALYIEGPSTTGVARLRAESMLATKPDNIRVKTLKGDWTQLSARKNITSWLGMSTSRNMGIAAIVCQNDAMAMGARDAFGACLSGVEREQWLSLPITGCDGLPDGGRELVRKGMLTATIIVPPNAGLAVSLCAQALKGQPVPERTSCEPKSWPPEEKLHELLTPLQLTSTR